ncbi:hypothetical protein FRB94_013025 [Tulasnella sp. JGI-2019a]|nr:hypothetical protein FRB94_013025 [Tulasnella sp. JGI-2019a]KAG8997580.1 hypothetical protein FRB93_014038 [Tulasnella sp. JGI-2019a]
MATAPTDRDPIFYHLTTLTKALCDMGSDGWDQITATEVEDVPRIGELEDEQPPVLDMKVPFKVIDLSNLLQRFFPVESKTRILYRKEYQDLYQMLKDHRLQYPENGAVVTGLPGIGKTVFLFYLMIALTMDGEPFAVHVDPKYVYLVRGPGLVEIIDMAVAGHTLQDFHWALSDSDAESIRPPSIFVNYQATCYVVQTTSPHVDRWWWKKHRGAKSFVMEPFSWGEMYFVGYVEDKVFPRVRSDTGTTRKRISTPSVDLNVLAKMFTLYGSSPRLCIDITRDENSRTTWENSIHPILSDIANLPQLISQLFLMKTTKGDMLSQLFPLHPGPVRQPVVDVATPYIFGKIIDVLESKDDATYWNTFNIFRLLPQTSMNAGRLWRSFVKGAFCKGSSTRVLEARKLPETIEPGHLKKKREKVPAPSIPIHFPFNGFNSFGPSIELEDGVELYVPEPFDDATFDALSVVGDLITLFQVTLSQEHSVKASDLDGIWEKLTQNFPGKTCKQLQWRLVFVVPADVGPAWKRVQAITPKEHSQDWDHVSQFVASFPLPMARSRGNYFHIRD